MGAHRLAVSGVLSRWLETHLSGMVSDCGVTAKDKKLFLEAAFWRVRNGSAQRDRPPAFGYWNSQSRRLRRWAKTGVFKVHLKALGDDPDLEDAHANGTVVRIYQKSTGEKGGPQAQPFERSQAA